MGDLQFNQVFNCACLWNGNLYKHRYFSGHTRNPDGSVQFTAGKTKVGDAINGTIKIVTVAVCALRSTGLPVLSWYVYP